MAARRAGAPGIMGEAPWPARTGPRAALSGANAEAHETTCQRLGAPPATD